jgi:hypothetical protein
MKEALSYYEKYMSLTDYSWLHVCVMLISLIVTHISSALEIEANKIENDNVNQKLRYLS